MGIQKLSKYWAPYTENPNTPNKDGVTPIYWAACEGCMYRNCQNLGHLGRQS